MSELLKKVEALVKEVKDYEKEEVTSNTVDVAHALMAVVGELRDVAVNGKKQADLAEALDDLLKLPVWAEWADGPVIKLLVEKLSQVSAETLGLKE